MLQGKKTLVNLVSESYMTDGTLDQYYEHMDHAEPEVQGLIVELDKHEEAMRQLQAIQHVVDDSLQNGCSLSQGAAHMVGIVTESIHKRYLNLPYHGIVPALENFQQPATKHMATRICLEGLVDSIKKIAAKILEIIQTVWTKIKEFFARVFSKKETLKKDLEKVQETAEAIPKDAKPDSQMLSLHPVATEDHSDTQILMHKIPFGIASHCDGETTSKIIDDTSVLVTSNREIVVHIVECLKNVDGSPIDYKGLQDGVYRLVDEIKNRLSRLEMKSKKMKGNKVLYIYGNLVDSQHCEVKEIFGLEDASDKPRIFNLDVQIDAPEHVPLYHPRVLKREEMSKIAVASIRLLDQSQNLDKVIPIVEKVLNKNLEVLRSKIDQELNRNPQQLYLSISAVKDLFRYISHNLPKLSSDSNKIAVGVKHYITLSAAHYKVAH